MKYVPFSGGSRALKNKFIRKAYCESESVRLLWSSHKGTFTKGGGVQQSGPSQGPSNLLSKDKLGGSRKTTKKMNKTEEHKFLNVNVYNISKIICH